MTDTSIVVYQIGHYHEDGFEILASFDDEDAAEEYVESGQAAEDGNRSMPIQTTTEVPHNP